MPIRNTRLTIISEHVAAKDGGCLIVIRSHYTFVIALCASYLVARTTVPYTDGLLHIIRRIVVALYEYEHLTTLFYTEAVIKRVAPLVASFF